MIVSTTNEPTTQARSADLLAAVADLGTLTLGSDPATQGSVDADAPSVYAGLVERISTVAGESGYTGLQSVSLLFQDYLEIGCAQDEDASPPLRDALQSWPGLVQRYLTAPPGSGAVDALIQHLQLPLWDPPLMPEDVEMLQGLLREERPQTAEVEETPSVATAPAQEETASIEAGPEQAEAVPIEAAPEPEVTEPAAAPFAAPVTAPEAPPAMAQPPIERSEEAPEPAPLPRIEPETTPAAVQAPIAQIAQIETPAVISSATEEHPEDDALEELPPAVAELVTMLLEELPTMDESLERLLQAEMTSEADPDERTEAADAYADYLDRFAGAAETIGFSGLQQAVARLRENLNLLTAQPRAINGAESELLAAWSTHASLYLLAPHSPTTCRDLTDWLQAPAWPQPLVADQAKALQALLQSPALPDPDLEEKQEARPRHALPEDVSLALPDDVNTDLLDALLQELPAQSRTFSEAIHNLIAGGSLNDIEIAQRTAHTLKGAGNTVGVFGLANLTHQLEDILDALAKQQTLPTGPLSLSLMNAADCLEAMGEALSGQGEPPDNAREVLQEVLDWANRIDQDGLPEADAPAQPEIAVPEPAAEPTAHPAESAPAPAPAEDVQQAQAATPSQVSTTRVATGLLDDLLRRGGETIILSGQVHEQVRRIDERMHAMRTEFERLQRLGGDLERLIDISDLNTGRGNPEETAGFDPLEMDQYSELHTASRMLVEAATDAREIGTMVTDQLQRLDTMLLTQERLNRETQETVLSARMVPIKTVVPRLQRSVRQTCRLTGKQVELHLNGTDTLMDGEVLNELLDPLMHVLRNAVDHGIEPAAQRTATGKPESGHIQLDFLREGNNILVRCRDDGAGFDYAAIRRAARSRGLLEPDQEASEDELSNLLLMPGFSSRSEVTQTSGRGAGLDVVYSHVLAQGGSLTLGSEPGKGCTTELQLPVSLVSTHALLVRIRDQVMAVADRGIERILHADDGVQRNLGGRITLQVGERIYPIKALEELLQLTPDRRTEQRSPMPVLLVKGRSGVTAVPVQEVLAGTDLVVKEIGRYIPRLPGMLGATILGDGAVTPVLDLPELMSGTHRKPAPTPLATASETEQQTPGLPQALVVDDSLSARRALIQVMEDAGYQVRAARDGLEAVQQIETQRPDIVLADMEMPRMNGIELTAHLRARPETVDLPVIMVTSRSSAKHRRRAKEAGVDAYLTKPFPDDQLLDQVALLRGRT